MHADIGEGLPPQHPLNNMMFLEYAGRDTLNKLFCSLNDAHMYPPHPPLEAIPNRILWLMFQCRTFAAPSVEDRRRADVTSAVITSGPSLCRDGAPAHKGLGNPPPHRC